MRSVLFFFIATSLYTSTYAMESVERKSEFKGTIRNANYTDKIEICELYKKVASEDGLTGLARSKEEITDSFISDTLHKGITAGLLLVAEENGHIIGAVSKWRPEPKSLKHCLCFGATLVHPDHAGRGIATKLWEEFITTVNTTMPEITRIELFTRASNKGARHVYTKVGFKEIAELPNRIMSTNGLEADILMAWKR